MKQNFILHLTIGLSLYLLSASMDTFFTLQGLDGDISMEGNPVIRYMMVVFGPAGGLVVEKTLVFIIALFLAVVTAIGIEKKAAWVYSLALTQWTRNWMKQKKRRWVAFIPIYFVAAAQALAAASWIILFIGTGRY